jgi:HAMP domain-containing protein
MSFLRLWLFLLTLVAGVAVAFAVMAPRGVSEDLDRELDARLERTHHAASLLLRVNARKWIDTSAQVASDAVLVESLDQATRGPTDLALVHKTVQERLRYFNERMKVDLVSATDARGRVIARVGVDADVYRDSIEGYPLVADALRGLRGDDTWSIGGKLYRVAASPVILRDRYVGTVVIGQEATAELAESMKTVLGAEVVLLLHGRVIASTATLPNLLDRLPIAATAHAAELAHGGRSAPITVDTWAVIMGSFVGEAGDHQAIFALCAPRYGGSSLQAIATSIVHRDPRTLPVRTLLPVGIGTLAALLLGLIFVWRLGTRPVAQLLRQVQALSRGELQRLPDAQHGGRFGALARAINTTIDRLGGRYRAERSSPNVDEGTRTTPRRQSGGKSTPPVPNAPTAAAPSSPPLPSATRPSLAPPEPDPTDIPASPTQATSPEVPMATEFDERKTRARDPWAGAPPAPKNLFTQSLTPLPPPIAAIDTEPVSATGTDVRTMQNVMPPPLPSAASLPALPAAETRTANAEALGAALTPPPPAPPPPPPTGRASTPRSGFEEPTSVESPSEALLIATAHGTDDEIEADFHRVFDAFIASRTQCGETLDGVTFDKFVIKLRQNRSQLIQRYGCASVRFQVYVKDGKTALKATPVT